MVERLPTEERFRSNRIFQRCPNCELRADVSLHVAGALIRCTHCNVRFQVERPEPPSAARPHVPDDPTVKILQEKIVKAVDAHASALAKGE